MAVPKLHEWIRKEVITSGRGSLDDGVAASARTLARGGWGSEMMEGATAPRDFALEFAHGFAHRNGTIESSPSFRQESQKSPY